jgi:CHASE2 domain-containing sensor protein
VKRVAGVLVGLGAAVLVLGGERLFSTVSRAGLSPFELAELRTYDWRLTHTARPEEARKDIAIVEIDEFSLRSLQANAGRWPWPRAVHSMLIDYLNRGPAKVIAYDMEFTEQSLDQDADNAFYTSVQKADQIVLATTTPLEGGATGPSEVGEQAGRAKIAPSVRKMGSARRTGQSSHERRVRLGRWRRRHARRCPRTGAFRFAIAREVRDGGRWGW